MKVGGRLWDSWSSWWIGEEGRVVVVVVVSGNMTRLGRE